MHLRAIHFATPLFSDPCMQWSVPPFPTCQPPNLSNVAKPFRAIPFRFILLCTLLHFLALPKNRTLLFSSDSALFAKKGGGGNREVASGKYGTSFCRYITSLRLFLPFPAETASARQAEYRRWPRVPGTAAGAAQAPLLSILSRYQ
jgi:hypothetical protein